MNLRDAKIYVTAHAMERWYQRINQHYAPEHIAEFVKRSKPVKIKTRRRYRLRFADGEIWRRRENVFYLIAPNGTKVNSFVLVTVISIEDAGRNAKEHRRGLREAGVRPNRRGHIGSG